MIDILSEYPATQTEIGQILRISNPDDMVGPLSSWSMNVILKKYNEQIEKGECLTPSHFLNFGLNVFFQESMNHLHQFYKL